MSAACSGPTAGTVTFTGTESRNGVGQPSTAASRAQRSHGAATRASYSRNGLNSPHPAGPRSSRPSRMVMPRNLVRMGIEKTWVSTMHEHHLLDREPVHLAVREQRDLLDPEQLPGRPLAWMHL